MNELLLDFAEVADFESIRQRVFLFFQVCDEVREVEVIVTGTEMEGYSKNLREVNFNKTADLSGFARVVGALISIYALGSDHTYSSAKVVVLSG